MINIVICESDLQNINLSIKKLVPTLTVGLIQTLRLPFVKIDKTHLIPFYIKCDFQFNNGTFVYVRNTQDKQDVIVTIPVNHHLICNCDKNLLYNALKYELQSRFGFDMELYPITGNSRIGIHIKTVYNCI